jgi:hypothetical protein
MKEIENDHMPLTTRKIARKLEGWNVYGDVPEIFSSPQSRIISG